MEYESLEDVNKDLKGREIESIEDEKDNCVITFKDGHRVAVKATYDLEIYFKKM